MKKFKPACSFYCVAYCVPEIQFAAHAHIAFIRFDVPRLYGGAFRDKFIDVLNVGERIEQCGVGDTAVFNGLAETRADVSGVER